MNIGFVCPEFPVHDSANGVSTYTSRMVESLVRRGHRLTTFCLRSRPLQECGQLDEVNGVRILWVGFGGTRRSATRRIWRYLRHRLARGHAPCRELAIDLRRTILDACEEEAIDVLQCPEWRGCFGGFCR